MFSIRAHIMAGRSVATLVNGTSKWMNGALGVEIKH